MRIIGGSSAGLNLLTNTAVAANNANAVIAIVAEPSVALSLQAGSAYTGTIEFVPTTETKFTKIVSGSDTFYGMLKVTSVVPGKSVSMDYKIGDQYAHLSIIK